MRSILQKALGDPNKRYIKTLQPLVKKINDLEEQIQPLYDEELKAKTEEFKQQYKDGKSLDDILPEAFAVVREDVIMMSSLLVELFSTEEKLLK